MELFRLIRSAIDSGQPAALETAASHLRQLQSSAERRVACLALHDVAGDLPVRGTLHFQRILKELQLEDEEHFLRVLAARLARP